ncbi:hypothetical protein B0H14DRAFT_2561964 [Mycena olivaceomarginata]|nr:hypothetical protein B0H14DRAFT_2561964 [Mycena olivaceomarginata]
MRFNSAMRCMRMVVLTKSTCTLLIRAECVENESIVLAVRVVREQRGVSDECLDNIIEMRSGGPKSGKSSEQKYRALRRDWGFVNHIKGVSGFSWSDEPGANISAASQGAWDAWVAVNPKAARFRNKGWPFYDPLALGETPKLAISGSCVSRYYTSSKGGGMGGDDNGKIGFRIQSRWKDGGLELLTYNAISRAAHRPVNGDGRQSP